MMLRDRPRDFRRRQRIIRYHLESARYLLPDTAVLLLSALRLQFPQNSEIGTDARRIVLGYSRDTENVYLPY